MKKLEFKAYLLNEAILSLETQNLLKNAVLMVIWGQCGNIIIISW
jgi:hypothetical protein